MKNATTYTTSSSSKPLTVDDLIKAKEAIESISPFHVEKFEVSKKKFKQLKKQFHGANIKVGALYGIPVYIKPYLKKIRAYYSNGKVESI